MKKTFIIFAVATIAIALIFAFLVNPTELKQLVFGDSQDGEQVEALTQEEYEEAANKLRLQQLQTYELYVMAFMES